MMDSIHIIWWNTLDNKVKDDLINTMHTVCQLGLDIESIVETRFKKITEDVKDLTLQLNNEKEHTRLVLSDEIHKEKIQSQIKITTLESENNELTLKLREKEYFINNINITPDTTMMHEIKDLILQTMHYKKQNADLGNDGEQLIDSLIYSKYPDCEIIDTSGIKNKGDRIVCFKDFSVLIESKNVKQESLSGSMKRYTDQITTDLLKEQTIRVGILASIRDVTFNGGDYFRLDSIQTTSGTFCIIYCSNIKHQPFLLFSAIQLARKITNILVSQTNDTSLLDAIRATIPAINGTLMAISKNQTMLENLCDSNRLVFACLEKTLKTLTDTTNNDNQFTDPQQEIKDLYSRLSSGNSNVTSKQLKTACEQRGINYDNVKLVGGLKQLRLSEKSRS